MSRRITKYMKEKTLSVWCPRCEATSGQPCHTNTGGYSQLHEERRTNARKRVPLTGPVVKKTKTKASETKNSSNIEAWKNASEEYRTEVMSRTCPACQSKPGAICRTLSSKNWMPIPHRERMIGQAYTTNPCPDCGAKVGKDCQRPDGKPYNAGFVHMGRRKLLAEPGGLPSEVSAPHSSEIVIIDVEEETTGKTVLLTHEMAVSLAAHLRGETTLSEETVATFADLLHHIPTPLEKSAFSLANLSEDEFFDLNYDQRVEWIETAKASVAAFIEGAFLADKLPQDLWDAAVEAGVLT